MSIANAAQAEHWNTGPSVGHWVANQAAYDRMHRPFTDLILGAAALAPGQTVLDVGCGAGGTTVAAARLAAPGRVLGVDLSGPMLGAARSKAADAGLGNVAFEQDDVQVRDFGADRFDAVISRFGVMFFDDPVAAFANIRSAMTPGGRLAFACWQPLAANEWLLVQHAALAQYLPSPEGFGSADGPGMFAFSSQDRVRTVLAGAGWHGIEITPANPKILVGGGGTVDDAVTFLRTATTARTMLAGADKATAERAIASLRAALVPHADADGVHLGTGVWLVQATV
jgi:SAM-dependent methyltransferase